jgi:hypothetical protein
VDEKEEVYFDESWVEPSFTFQKCWHKSDDMKGLITGSS